jgi:hypothetical protein
MTIARLGGFCALVFLLSAPASANNECATTKPGDQEWDAQFLIDSAAVDSDLTAKVTGKTDNVGEVLMPDLAAGSKGWNACYEMTGDDGAWVEATYSTKDGTVRFVLHYNMSAGGTSASLSVKQQEIPAYTAVFEKPSTVSLSGE